MSKITWQICKQRLGLSQQFPLLPIHKLQGQARPSVVDVWLHASSAGELRLLVPLISELSQRCPQSKIHLTVMTNTAYYAVAKLFAKFRISYSCLPLDTPFCMQRLIKQLQPKVVMITEADHWPNLLQVAKKNKLPVWLINGRISKSSWQRFKTFPRTSRRLLNLYNHLFVKSELDYQRYLSLGVEESKLDLAGNMKFDAPLLHQTYRVATKAKLRERLGLDKDSFLFVAGSTRPPAEEKILIEAFSKLELKPGMVLALAPRHLKRTAKVKELLDKNGFTFCLYSTSQASGVQAVQGCKENYYMLIDEIGVLNELFTAADLAFVGGTMSNLGGHNILEPVWAGTPVLFGPDTANISDLADYVLSNQYGAQFKNPAELYNILKNFIDGRLKFKEKTKIDKQHSPSQKIVSYVLNRKIIL